MNDRINQARRRLGTGHPAEPARDDRSMRLLELALAFTAIGVAVLLAVPRL